MKMVMIMSRNMNRFDPFARHRTTGSVPKPDRAETVAPVAAEAATVQAKPAPVVRNNNNPFSRHADEKKPSRQPRLDRALKLAPPQALLDWLVRDQARNIVTVRDICRLGPGQIRNRERALDSAKILVEHGWLIPLEAHRHDRHRWQVVRKPILCPILPTVAATP
jgi:hypothetical protein